METDPQLKWDARYRSADRVAEAAEVAEVLSANRHLLPHWGVALDLACGLGGNALLLAEHGLETHAWDVSSVAIARLAVQARRQGLIVRTAVRDVERDPPAAEGFDVIVVSRYLHRPLLATLAEALRPGGLLFYQTFTLEATSERGPTNPAYRLQPGELLERFRGLRIRFYREEGRLGDIRRGWRDEAMLVAEKPAF